MNKPAVVAVVLLAAWLLLKKRGPAPSPEKRGPAPSPVNERGEPVFTPQWGIERMLEGWQ